jgi:hypothetical protein
VTRPATHGIAPLTVSVLPFAIGVHVGPSKEASPRNPFQPAIRSPTANPTLSLSFSSCIATVDPATGLHLLRINSGDSGASRVSPVCAPPHHTSSHLITRNV